MSLLTPTRPFGRKQPPIPLPDPKYTYEPLLKRELASRLVLICATSFAFTYIVSFLATANLQKGPPLGLFGHVLATTLMALCALVIGAGPPLMLRGHAVSAPYAPLPTHAGTFMALLSSTRTWRTLAYFSASGFSLTLLHVAFINMSEWEDSRLSVLAPTRRNAFRLNERFFYLAFFNASLGLVFASRDLIRHRWTTRWPSASDERDNVTVHTRATSALEAFFAALNHKALLSTILITMLHALFFPLSYRLSRAFALPILRNLPGLSWLTRPLLHGFGRTWAVDVPWSRMLALGLKTSLGWELVETAFDYWSTKPITTSPKAQDPNQALVAGLHSPNRYFKHHAYLELSSLASSRASAASTRRTALFTDTKTAPTLWSALVREVLVTLGRDYQCLLRRGKPATPAPASAPAPVHHTPRTPRSPSTPLLRQPILKPSPRSLFDTLGSEGAATKALTSVASLPESISMPSVFLPSAPSTPRVEKKAIVKAPVNTPAPVMQIMQRVRAGRGAIMMGLVGWVEGNLPSEWKVREWWTSVSLERQAKACLPEKELDVAGVEALSYLIAASLTEDSLGSVQRDIPRVLEAMLSFLAEAEAYQAELEAKLPPPPDPDDSGVGALEAIKAAKEIAHAVEVVLPIITALRSGVGLIAKTFGDRLGVYKFPPVTTKRLQSFMDYL